MTHRSFQLSNYCLCYMHCCMWGSTGHQGLHLNNHTPPLRLRHFPSDLRRETDGNSPRTLTEISPSHFGHCGHFCLTTYCNVQILTAVPQTHIGFIFSQKRFLCSRHHATPQAGEKSRAKMSQKKMFDFRQGVM